jgi:CRISPR-associated protein Cas5h
MKGALLEVKGNWGHFKKPETNNNPLTHDLITKTALIGMIGAVIGIERKEMAQLFPQLSEDLVYGVSICNPVKKVSWAFTMRRAVNPTYQYPKQMEFLRNPSYLVAIGLLNERSEQIMNNFISAVEKEETKFTPVLGLHNCPANLRLVASAQFHRRDGDFITTGFITNNQLLKNIATTKDFRIGIDRIPTYQDGNCWNPPDKYIKVIYPSEGRKITATGEYYQFEDKSEWALI